MKNLLITLAFLPCLLFAQTFQGPLLITKGGKYSGNYRSTDPNTAAITISCYDPVEITGCLIESAGIGIKAYGGTKLNIHHNTIKGIAPTGQNQWGRALDDYHPQYLIFENNTVDHTGGLMVDHSDENTKTAVIRYNKILNTDKRKGDNTQGDHRAGILFNTATITGEIAWNYFYNAPHSSWIEDNINLGNVVAPKSTPLLVHDNYIFGAYPFPTNFQEGSFTGSGITVEGEPGRNTYENVSQNIKIYNNQVISTMNGGINVNAGHDIEVTGNTIISSGMLPNGTRPKSFWSGGAIWNGSNVPYPSVFNNIVFKDNVVGYYREGGSVGGANRQDWTFVSGSPISVDPAKNISLPNPITLATEQAEYPKFLAKLAANNITIGNAVNNPNSGTVVVTPVTGTSLRVGQTRSGTITALDSTGKVVSFKSGSVIITGDAYTTITRSTTDEKSFQVTGIAAGSSTITVQLTTNNGKVLTQTAVLTVLPLLEEATSINISFND